jgi:hypothetical protein
MMVEELQENPDIFVLMNLWISNFDSGSRKYMGILVTKILIPNYYVLHN